MGLREHTKAAATWTISDSGNRSRMSRLLSNTARKEDRAHHTSSQVAF